MAIKLRFAMHGMRNNRILHLVAIDHRKARNAKPVETLAIYKHRIDGPGEKKKLDWSVDRIRYWLNVGAEPTPSVVRLLEMGGILMPGSPYHPKKAVLENKSSAKSNRPTTTAKPTAPSKSS